MVSFRGIFKRSQRDGWVKAVDIRKPKAERMLWTRRAAIIIPTIKLKNLLKEDIVLTTDGRFIIDLNDPFSAIFLTKCKTYLDYENIIGFRQQSETPQAQSTTTCTTTKQVHVDLPIVPSSKKAPTSKRNTASAQSTTLPIVPSSKKAPNPPKNKSTSKRNIASATVSPGVSGTTIKVKKPRAKKPKPQVFILEAEPAPSPITTLSTVVIPHIAMWGILFFGLSVCPLRVKMSNLCQRNRIESRENTGRLILE